MACHLSSIQFWTPLKCIFSHFSQNLFSNLASPAGKQRSLSDTESSVRPSTFPVKSPISQKLFYNFFSSFEYNTLDLIESLFRRTQKDPQNTPPWLFLPDITLIGYNRPFRIMFEPTLLLLKFSFGLGSIDLNGNQLPLFSSASRKAAELVRYQFVRRPSTFLVKSLFLRNCLRTFFFFWI